MTTYNKLYMQEMATLAAQTALMVESPVHWHCHGALGHVPLDFQQ